jgi:hypothetical protein
MPQRRVSPWRATGSPQKPALPHEPDSLPAAFCEDDIQVVILSGASASERSRRILRLHGWAAHRSISCWRRDTCGLPSSLGVQILRCAQNDNLDVVLGIMRRQACGRLRICALCWGPSRPPGRHTQLRHATHRERKPAAQWGAKRHTQRINVGLRSRHEPPGRAVQRA